jgi:hypothetical protein
MKAKATIVHADGTAPTPPASTTEN